MKTSRNEMLKDPIKYYGKLSTVKLYISEFELLSKGDTKAALLLAQFMYWWNKMGRKAFYKHKLPPRKRDANENKASYESRNPEFIEGSSWVEEFPWTRKCIDAARSKIMKPLNANTPELDEEFPLRKYIVYYVSNNNMTTYDITDEKAVNELLRWAIEYPEVPISITGTQRFPNVGEEILKTDQTSLDVILKVRTKSNTCDRLVTPTQKSPQGSPKVPCVLPFKQKTTQKNTTTLYGEPKGSLIDFSATPQNRMRKARHLIPTNQSLVNEEYIAIPKDTIMLDFEEDTEFGNIEYNTLAPDGGTLPDQEFDSVPTKAAALRSMAKTVRPIKKPKKVHQITPLTQPYWDVLNQSHLTKHKNQTTKTFKQVDIVFKQLADGIFFDNWPDYNHLTNRKFTPEDVQRALQHFRTAAFSPIHQPTKPDLKKCFQKYSFLKFVCNPVTGKSLFAVYVDTPPRTSNQFVVEQLTPTQKSMCDDMIQQFCDSFDCTIQEQDKAIFAKCVKSVVPNFFKKYEKRIDKCYYFFSNLPAKIKIWVKAFAHRYYDADFKIKPNILIGPQAEQTVVEYLIETRFILEKDAKGIAY